jgi:hypothetical protein
MNMGSLCDELRWTDPYRLWFRRVFGRSFSIWSISPNGGSSRHHSDVLLNAQELLLECNGPRRGGNRSKLHDMRKEQGQGTAANILPQGIPRLRTIGLCIYRYLRPTAENLSRKSFPIGNHRSVLEAHPYGAATKNNRWLSPKRSVKIGSSPMGRLVMC